MNVHIRNHESGASRVVHLNKCKSIPNYGEGVNDGLAWLEESTKETGIDGNHHQKDDEAPDEVELTEQDTRSSPINPQEGLLGLGDNLSGTLTITCLREKGRWCDVVRQKIFNEQVD